MNSIRKSIHKFKREQAFRRDASLIEKNITCRVLIVLHLYYLEEWDEIREYLKSLTCYPYKLVITYPVVSWLLLIRLKWKQGSAG